MKQHILVQVVLGGCGVGGRVWCGWEGVVWCGCGGEGVVVTGGGGCGERIRLLDKNNWEPYHA